VIEAVTGFHKARLNQVEMDRLNGDGQPNGPGGGVPHFLGSRPFRDHSAATCENPRNSNRVFWGYDFLNCFESLENESEGSQM
jgi:hypothetical protein